MAYLPEYLLRILPGLALVIVCFVLVPKKQIVMRIFLLIFVFVLVRDAMTPIGYWVFGFNNSTMGLPRFINDPLLLVFLALIMLVAVVIVLCVKDLRELVFWGKYLSVITYLVGIFAGLLVAIFALAFMALVGMNSHVASVPISLIPYVLLFALVGNFFEELLFRGFMQSYLARQTSVTRSIILSGLLFAVAHIFLAYTVTNLGFILIIFVLFEGLVCAFVYKKFGLVSSSLTHGIGIFILASGLV